jgi:putative cell wall-binding protein
MLVVTMPASALGAVTLTWERNWGSKGTLPALANGEFYYPSDVATDKWGNVYVAGGEDGDHRIQMFAPDGTFLKSVGTVSAPSTLLDRPKSVATDRWGNIYVGEYGNGHRINVFFPELYNGVSARTIDGTGDSDIASPRTISVGLDGTLYTVKSGAEIQRWTSGGDYLGKWTAAGWATTGIGVAQDGNVYTTTDQDGGTTHSVVKYDALGDYLDDWGGFGSTDGLLNRPYDVGTDPLENVYVIESMGARGQVFESAGTFLTTFGTPGSGDGQFNLPYGISVSLDRNVYVAEQFGHRISKWNATVPTEAREVAGPNRYATAVEASKRAYPDGCDTVVIATGANWPDALGGAALAGAVHAPLLLTTKDSLPAVVSAEIDRLDAHYAYVLGSNAAVSDAVVTQLQGHLMMTNRLGGADRYATANLIAAETVDRMNADGGYDGTAFVATGLNFPDALAASPIAAANGWPIYLTRKTDLPSTVRSAMIANGSNHGYILGSTDAVGAAVATELNTAPFMEFTRYGGTNRYETAAKIADAGFDGMGMLWSRPALAVGTNFPDALAGGVLQGSDCSVILLTPKDTLDPYAAAALTANRDSIYELRFLGSTAALGDVPRNAAKALLH